MRREYIIHSVIGNAALVEEAKQEVLVDNLYKAISQNSLGELLSRLGIPVESLKVNPEKLDPKLSEQLRLYTNIKSNIDALYTTSLLKNKVKPFFPSINSLTSEQLESLVSQGSQFIRDVMVIHEKNPLYSPDIPQGLFNVLSEAKMNIKFGSTTEIGERVDLLMLTITIARAILNNRQDRTYNNTSELEEVIAQYLYLQDTPVELVD